MSEFCYSMDGETYEGRYDTRDDALDAALQNCEGYHFEVYTARIKDWFEFADARQIGWQIEDDLNDELNAEMAAEEYPLDLTGRHTDLGKVVIAWIKANITPSWYCTDDEQKHNVAEELAK